jgi:hypothetical protein
MNYFEQKEYMKNLYSGADSSSEKKYETLSFDPEETLSVDDIRKDYKYNQPIRDYMIERMGVDYQTKSDEDVVDDFVKHMRYFNANTVMTAGEVRFVTKANKRQKETARKAYQIYDQLGNVFVNDGLMGAVKGVGDYVFAAASDPTNYLGILTGGIGRAAAGGVQVSGKQVIKAAVRKAGRDALRSGATKKAAREAGRKAGKEAAERAAARGMTDKRTKGIYDKVSKLVETEAKKAIPRDAMKEAQKNLFRTAATKSLYATTALDATAAVYQDIANQEIMLDVGAQETFSKTQSAFSGLLGGVAGGAQLVARKLGAGKSGFEDTRTETEKLAQNTIDLYAPILKKADAPEAAKAIRKATDKWNAKVARGKKGRGEVLDDSQLIREIMFGDVEGEIGGLVGVFRSKGYKVGKEVHISDVMTNVANSLTQKELEDINIAFAKHTGFKFGDLTGARVKLGDLMADRFSEAGKTLQVASQVSKTLNSGLLAAETKIKLQSGAIKEAEEGKEITLSDGTKIKKPKPPEPLRYGQSVWKRLLVSSPATTALNVAGFSQYYVGQTIADLFSSTALMTKGVAQSTYNTKAAQESFRQARALSSLQVQKLRNLMDPYTTRDAYMKFLEDPENLDAQKVLFETMAGGVDASAKRYGMNPDSKAFRNVEAFTRAMNQITGVRIQDTFTKSQMFMTDMDKYLRLKRGVTLKEALLSDDIIIDDEVISGALDTTLKSVFAKDYTTKEQPEIIRTAAKFVETVSNTPFLGTILPFGRFFNNVVATAYQWGPFSAPETLLKPMYKRIVKKEGMGVSEMDAAARTTVGIAGLILASQYDKERRDEGLGVYEINVGGGKIIDAKNTYPFSAFLAAGRIFNMKLNGETVPPELIQEMGTQVAVGQLAKDAQFGNDLNNLLDVLINQDEGARGAQFDAFNKTFGNFLAGVTRPLDAVNKVVGFAMGTDAAKDVRQADGLGLFTQTSTKYFDNILEAFIGKTDTITGEDLKVATREGEIYDANPFARIFGLTIKQGRTATEKAYSMSEMQAWTANERSKLPAYDRAFNGMLAPILERQTQRLLRTEQFMKADLPERRGMLKAVLRSAKKQIRERLDEGYTTGDNVKLRAAYKAKSKFSKEITTEAKKVLKEKFGVSGDIEDYSFAELDLFISYSEHLKDAYDEAGQL